MTREWKPGDVATWPGMGPVLCVGKDEHSPNPYRTKWAHKWEGFSRYDGEEIRPLVVIDPEDREQVGRLTGLYLDAEGSATEVMQAALREFADPTPPKPDEPLGIGAVVEDNEGERWVRRCANADDAAYLEKPWLCGAVNKNWQIVAAVKVLSEGVQP